MKYLRDDMYKILRSILFIFPAEEVHHFSMRVLKVICNWGVLRRLVAWSCLPEAGDVPSANLAPNASTNPAPNAVTAPTPIAVRPYGLHRAAFGLSFRNPVGLGAGFDKNALYLRELEALGFGFVEIGTVTPLPQPGNEPPRLFRLPEDQGLINRMEFNNDGAEAIAGRLRKWRESQGSHQTAVWDRQANSPLAGKNRIPAADGRMIIGGNIGKNKTTPNQDAWKDYEICFRALYREVDYFVVNVSSPNTPGLRELQEKDALHRILTNLQKVNAILSEQYAIQPRPLLLKIAPDLSWSQIDEVIALSLEIRLDGLVAANTTVSREGLLSPAGRIESIGAGGLSGAPLRERSTQIVRYIHERTGGSIPMIASGGIFTAEDAREKLAGGASLVQVWTGFIYIGPFITRRICRAL